MFKKINEKLLIHRWSKLYHSSRALRHTQVDPALKEIQTRGMYEEMHEIEMKLGMSEQELHQKMIRG